MYLGIDLGTSAVKTILVDHEQRVVASRSRSLTVNSPRPGYSEQDPRQWIDATFATLDDLKADELRFFNFVYGGRFGNAPDTDDGFAYRGRGPFQLTFKDNYKRIGDMIGHDLVGDPDLVNDIAIGPQTVVAYIQDRYDGSGWQAMKDCVGFNTPDIAARKDQLRAQFLASGEFA